MTFLAVMLLSVAILALTAAYNAHTKTLRLHNERLSRLERSQTAADRREGL